MYSAFGIIVTATFVVTAVLHLRTLSETMKAVSSDFALPTPRERVVIIQLKKQYRDLSVVVGAVPSEREGVVVLCRR